MQYSIVNFKDVFNPENNFRLDADYYHPSMLDAIMKITKNHTVPFSFLCTLIHPTEIRRVYSSKGIQIVLAQNVRNNFLDFCEIAYMDDKYAQVLERNLVRYNDILITRSGANFGQTACYKDKNKIVYACADIIIAQCRNNVFGGYISSFLNCKYGRVMLTRGAYGMAQPHISSSYLNVLQIPRFHDIFEELIDKHINLSYILDCKSAREYQSAQDLLLKELNLSGWKPKQQLSYIKNYSEAQSSGRLDAEYFHPKYDDILNAIKNYPNGWDVIENKFKQNKKLVKIVSNYSYNYVEIGSVNVETGEIYPQYMPADDLPANAKILLQKDDIIISKVRTYRGAIALVSKTDYIGSAAFTVLHETSDINKETLFVFLKLKPILNLTLKYNSGTSYPTIFDNDILNLPIPNFEQPIQAEIKDKIQSMYQMKEQSKQLLAIAQKGVEMAIEQNEQTATAWINQQLKQLGVEL